MNVARAPWFADSHGERRLFYTCLLVAIALHVSTLLWLGARPRSPALRPLVTEIQLAATAPIAPTPSAVVPDPPPTTPPRAATRARARRVPEPSPPPATSAAPAAALLTASGTSPVPAPEPVRFVSDPNGHGYASGVVAAGTTSRSKQPAPLPPSAAAAERITLASDLQQQPVWQGDDCRGYFPTQARVDLGHVAIVAVVRASGQIARLDVQTETPPSQGFAQAARACIQRQHFAPALDRQGRPAMARTMISLRFSR